MVSLSGKTSKGSNRDHKKSLSYKSKSHYKLAPSEKRLLSEKEISEVTLKRLHTLGSQKFGSSPYSQHFECWLANVESVIAEFESHPNIGVDDQVVKEWTETLTIIKQQLENRRQRETTIDQETKYLSECRSYLHQITFDYVKAAKTTRKEKNSAVRRLNSEISHLIKEQDKVIRLKTGFFRRISKKEREQKELEIIQDLNNKQTELELLVLDFNSKQTKLQEEYEAKREPVLEQIKNFRKMIREVETDGSLEERWFACEALIDSVNTFLQRKTAQQNALR